MLEKKTTVTDGLRIASSALDVICTSFTTSSIKHLISPGDGCHEFGAVEDTLFNAFWCKRLIPIKVRAQKLNYDYRIVIPIPITRQTDGQ